MNRIAGLRKLIMDHLSHPEPESSEVVSNARARIQSLIKLYRSMQNEFNQDGSGSGVGT